MLELLKKLLDIEDFDTSYDSVLNFYIDKAKSSIKKYCLLNEEEYTNANLTNPTVELALYYYPNRKLTGVKNYSEGNKSKSFECQNIPTSIKASLPSPPIYSA